jgi:CheY-like chemotaxis protein
MKNIKPILVVDDDDSECRLLQRALSAQGYEILFASNGLEAFNMLTLHKFSLIILDMRMPIADGWKFLDLYCDDPAPHIPIIAISAIATDIATMGCVKEFFSKPYDMRQLINCVRQYTEPQHTIEVIEPDNATKLQSDYSSKSLDDLRQKIIALREEISRSSEKTSKAEETLQTLNKLIERIEARKRAQSAVK